MTNDIVDGSNAKPFMFEVNFAAPESAKPIPTVPLPDHEAALKVAEQKGYQRGIKEGRSGEETRLANEAKRIGDAAHRILTAIDGDRVKLEKQSAELALTIAKKLTNSALAQYPLEEINTLISDCLGPLRKTPHLVVRLCARDADAIKETVGRFAQESGFEGRFVVLGEEGFASGDCRIEWADGGIVRDYQKIECEIEDKISRYFDGLVAEVGPAGIQELETGPETIPEENPEKALENLTQETTTQG